MTVEELSKACGFIPAFPLPDPEREVTCGFCGDLLSWAMVTHIEASKDFLSLQFICEIGMVQLASDESMEALFGSMEAERVHCIRANC